MENIRDISEVESKDLGCLWNSRVKGEEEPKDITGLRPLDEQWRHTLKQINKCLNVYSDDKTYLFSYLISKVVC